MTNLDLFNTETKKGVYLYHKVTNQIFNNYKQKVRGIFLNNSLCFIMGIIWQHSQSLRIIILYLYCYWSADYQTSCILLKKFPLHKHLKIGKFFKLVVSPQLLVNCGGITKFVTPIQIWRQLFGIWSLLFVTFCVLLTSQFHR